jgi:hypothetical protein
MDLVGDEPVRLAVDSRRSAGVRSVGQAEDLAVRLVGRRRRVASAVAAPAGRMARIAQQPGRTQGGRRGVGSSRWGCAPSRDGRGQGGHVMADRQFSWDDLGQYKAEGRFLDGYPDDERTFFAPRDNVHGLLVAVLGTAQHSIVVNMFGYDDDELNKIIQGKLGDEHVYVQMSLDRSQAAGVHEKKILASWDNNAFGNSIAIGTSSVHNAISHLKIVIVDGVYTVKGSTNWSLSGEQQQDNELTLSRSAVIAAETRAILDLNHDFMLKQMAGSKLDIAKLLAPADAASMPPLPPSPPSASSPAGS